MKNAIELEKCKHINLVSLRPDKDKNFGGSSVLNIRI